jgi:hypothetical protein
VRTKTHLLCAVLCGLFATTSPAATETYSGVAVDGSGPQAADRTVDLGGGYSAAATSYQGLVGYNSDPFTITDKVADVSRSAESELAAGRLATVCESRVRRAGQWPRSGARYGYALQSRLGLDGRPLHAGTR